VLLLLAVLTANSGKILEARLDAAVGEGPDVAVRLSFRVEPSADEKVSFSALEIEGVAIEEVSAFAGATSLPVNLEPRSSPKRQGSIGLPKGTDSFELRYLVRGGAGQAPGGLRVRLPCAILGLPLDEARAALFTSVVQIPAGLSLVDGFPSQSVAFEGGYRWELPLVPTFLAFRASSNAALLTPPRVASIAVTGLFLVLGVLGVRRARSSPR
jgi:hypothetical protein